MGWQEIAAAGALLVTAGCTFESGSGSGTAGLGGSTGDEEDPSGPSITDSDTTTGASGSASSDGPDPTEDSGTTEQPDPTMDPGTSGEETTGSPETSGTGSTGTQTLGPQIEISGDAFGTIDLGSSTNREFMLTNTGDEAAQMLEIAVGESFTLAGTDCPASLDPRESCGFRVAHPADALGLFSSTIDVSFDGGMQEEPISADVVGETENLVTDGGFESCPAGPWQDVGPGTWECGVNWVTPHGGSSVLAASTGPSDDAYVYRLELDLTPYANALTTGNMAFEFRTWARTWSTNDDEYRIRVRYRNEGGQNVSTYNSDWQTGGTWAEYDDIRMAPGDTVEIRIEFLCYKFGGAYCDAYFDDVELVGVYAGA